MLRVEVSGQGGGSGRRVCLGGSLPGCSGIMVKGLASWPKEATRDKVGARILPHKDI